MIFPRSRRTLVTMALQYVTALAFVCFLAVIIAHAVRSIAWRAGGAKLAAPAPVSSPTATPAPAPVETPAASAKPATPSAPAAKASPTTPPRVPPPEVTANVDPTLRDLLGKRLSIPIASVHADQLVRSFQDARTGHTHEALDILSPRGTPVIAVEDGTIAKLFWSKDGGHTIYQFDPSRRFAYYYAHLDRYADGLADGQTVRRGQTIGYVGSTGNANPASPHLHFGIFLLTPEQQWWKGTAIDPYLVLRWTTDSSD